MTFVSNLQEETFSPLQIILGGILKLRYLPTQRTLDWMNILIQTLEHLVRQ